MSLDLFLHNGERPSSQLLKMKPDWCWTILVVDAFTENPTEMKSLFCPWLPKMGNVSAVSRNCLHMFVLFGVWYLGDWWGSGTAGRGRARTGETVASEPAAAWCGGREAPAAQNKTQQQQHNQSWLVKGSQAPRPQLSLKSTRWIFSFSFGKTHLHKRCTFHAAVLSGNIQILCCSINPGFHFGENKLCTLSPEANWKLQLSLVRQFERKASHNLPVPCQSDFVNLPQSADPSESPASCDMFSAWRLSEVSRGGLRS